MFRCFRAGLSSFLRPRPSRFAVTRPTAEGGTETLPQHIGVRAVCAMPKSDGGTEETVGAVEAILSAMGILELRKDPADGASALAPAGGDRSWALAALAWFGSRLSPRPLSALQSACPQWAWTLGFCWFEMDDLNVYPEGNQAPISISCGVGFDIDWTTGQCRDTSLLPNPIGIPIGIPGGGGSPGGGSTTPTSPPPPPIPSGQPLSLSCGSGMRGEEVTCSITKDEGVEIRGAAWSFTPTASSSRKTTLSGAEESWGGTAVESGAMEVVVTYTEGTSDVEHKKTLNAGVDISARVWTWPAGQGGEDDRRVPDECFGTAALGLTVGRIPKEDNPCDPGYFFDYLNGFRPGAGSGPWAGTGFVASKDNTSSRAGAYWGRHPEIRSTAPGHDTSTLPRAIRNAGDCRGGTANVVSVNACSSNAGRDDEDNKSEVFRELRTVVETHETNHVQAVITEAGNHDVWRDWEGIVTTGESAARTVAQTDASEVQAALLSATRAVDADSSRREFLIWWWSGSGWSIVRVTTGH